tara:strand:- start:58 stop:738 length:681 start_codon:yes stop_codon:yes gene_type:complete
MPKPRRLHRFLDGTENKVCSMCKKWKPLTKFGLSSRAWDKLNSRCKPCKQAVDQKHKKNNVEYYKQLSKKAKRWPKWKVNAYMRKRRKDPVVRTKHIMRCRIWHCFNKYGVKKTAKTSELMGCTPQFLNAHLEKYFDDNMSWENRDKWDIDHVVPCCAFGISIEEQKILHWYDNLRPMWASDNRSKGGTYNEEDKIALIKRYNKINNTNYLEAQILDKQENCKQEQ